MKKYDINSILNGEKSPCMKLKGDLFELTQTLEKEMNKLDKKLNWIYRIFATKKKQEEREYEYKILKNDYKNIIIAYQSLGCKKICPLLGCTDAYHFERCKEETIVQ